MRTIKVDGVIMTDKVAVITRHPRIAHALEVAITDQRDKGVILVSESMVGENLLHSIQLVQKFLRDQNVINYIDKIKYV